MRDFQAEPKTRPGSLAEFVENTWWPTVAPGLTPTSEATYLQRYRNHIAALEHELLVDLRLDVLQQFVHDLGQTLSPKSAVVTYKLLAGILEMARRLGKYPGEDYKAVRLPRVARKPAPTLTPEQGRALLAAAEGTSLYGPIWAALHLGLRRGEVAGLRPSDIEIQGDRAIITVANNRQAGGREGPLKSKGRGEVRRLIAPRVMGEKLLAWSGPEYVFLVKNGDPMSPNRMSKAMDALCKAAGVPRVTFHDLRHSCATNLRDAGVPESVISSIIGHTSIDMTARYIQERETAVLSALTKLTEGD